jgi:hypothetical protein
VPPIVTDACWATGAASPGAALTSGM